MQPEVAPARARARAPLFLKLLKLLIRSERQVEFSGTFPARVQLNWHHRYRSAARHSDCVIWPRATRNQIKYNGERVQVHKKGNRFIFFTRAIKSVAEHKVEDMKEYVVDTFPEAETINAEMLMICKKTGKLLPFGTMGKNKRRRLCQQLPV
ncbi:hypothetical protein O3P69_002262 [Scylla paramamosain]|uniref:ATP-dependent DNA ligase family profile domain-containing protein n=1 Tax=Scylla paramamosain TaxID=85552 RepID=A0AAW0V7M2_SCYPA